MPTPMQVSPLMYSAMMGNKPDYVGYQPPPGGLGPAMQAAQSIPPQVSTDDEIFDYMAQRAGDPLTENRKLQMLIQLLQGGQR